jgi:hypothetical protein
MRPHNHPPHLSEQTSTPTTPTPSSHQSGGGEQRPRFTYSRAMLAWYESDAHIAEQEQQQQQQQQQHQTEMVEPLAGERAARRGSYGGSGGGSSGSAPSAKALGIIDLDFTTTVALKKTVVRGGREREEGARRLLDWWMDP